MTIDEKIEILKAQSKAYMAMYKLHKKRYEDTQSDYDFDQMQEYMTKSIEIDNAVFILTNDEYAEEIKKIYCPQETQ